MRYGWIYHAFLSAGIPLIRLGPGQKRLRELAIHSRCGSVEEIGYHLESGRNIGVVSYSYKIEGTINPHRFAVLDIDRWIPGIDLSPFTWRTRRPGQTVRAHYWFLMSQDHPLKASRYEHVWDLCPWNTVMPGSTHFDGSEYVLELLVDDEWVEWDGEPFSVTDLPCINPLDFLPPVPTERINKAKIKIDVSTIWVSATGKDVTRKKKAVYYLRNAARPSICHHGAHNALFVVIANLRLYFRLDWSEAHSLIREHYDRRCTWEDGRRYPWTDVEIRHKWDEAGTPGIRPTLGVADPRAKAKTQKEALFISVRSFLRTSTMDGGSCTATDLRRAFERWQGGEGVSAKAFGAAVRAVLGVGTSTSGGGRRYAGFHLQESACGDLAGDADQGLTSSA